MCSSILQVLPIVSGSIAALSAIAALFWGVWTHKRNAAYQVQLLALGALQHYLDLAVTHPDLASRDGSQPVNSIIRQHSAYLKAGAFVCGDYRPDFVSYLRSRVPDLKCAPATDWPP